MPLAIRCPNGHKLNVPSKYAGKSVNCPACKSQFEVPVPDHGASQAAAKAPKTKQKVEKAPPQKKRHRSKRAAAKGMTKQQQQEPTLSVSNEETTQKAPSPENEKLPDTAVAENHSPPLPPEVPAATDRPEIDPPRAGIAAATSVPEAEVIPPVVPPNRLQALLLERKLMGTELGYRPDRIHRTSVYWLATGQALLACFTAIPAFWQMGAEQIAPWIYVVLMLAFLQGAYAAWLCLSPDYSSAQVAMFASGLIAAIYAAATAVCWLTEARTGGWFHIGSLKMIYGNKPALWCAAVMLLASLVAYFCGHVSYRWQKTYTRMWPLKS